MNPERRDSAAAPEPVIAAIATALGGAVAIVRVSGRDAPAVATRLWQGSPPLPELPPRTLTLGRVCDRDGQPLDRVLAVRFPGGASYTGEPMVEFHAHGGPAGARAILEALYVAGARPAAPGEFTRRAFLNGRLDLTQAEAVADLIAANSRLALKQAEIHLEGRFGRLVRNLHRETGRLAAETEARLDFPEEPLSLATPAALAEDCRRLAEDCLALAGRQRWGDLLRHGATVVLAGPPNAGKSSLLNALLGRDRALVTPVPGTTRDTIEELAEIRGLPVWLVDTAGLRHTEEPVELAGIARARAHLAGAAVILWIMDATQPLAAQHPDAGAEWDGRRLLPVLNKCDLASPTLPLPWPAAYPPVTISVLTGAGLEALEEAVAGLLTAGNAAAGDLPAPNQRQAALLERAAAALRDAASRLASESWETAAVALRDAAAQLGRILGLTHTPDLLDTIFSRFCIGK
ncbi:MAG: tRNA uridine-5-carboxymethylaminomethyl(34) synthesis GTPase MnmE [Lentisphaeria bacterium]